MNKSLIILLAILIYSPVKPALSKATTEHTDLPLVHISRIINESEAQLTINLSRNNSTISLPAQSKLYSAIFNESQISISADNESHSEQIMECASVHGTDKLWSRTIVFRNTTYRQQCIDDGAAVEHDYTIDESSIKRAYDIELNPHLPILNHLIIIIGKDGVARTKYDLEKIESYLKTFCIFESLEALDAQTRISDLVCPKFSLDAYLLTMLVDQSPQRVFSMLNFSQLLADSEIFCCYGGEIRAVPIKKNDISSEMAMLKAALYGLTIAESNDAERTLTYQTRLDNEGILHTSCHALMTTDELKKTTRDSS